jgi:hypothetical protein
MTSSLAASLIGLLLESEFGATSSEAGATGHNRCTLEGVTWQPGEGGEIALRIRRLEAMALRLASGPFVLKIDRIDMQEISAWVRLDNGTPRLIAVEAADIAFSGLALQGPVAMPPQLQKKMRDASPPPAGAAAAAAGIAAGQAAADAWQLGPLTDAEGTLRSRITDAHLLFDADVTVPIRGGRIDFNDATVEHVGPDSRMGVSKMGVYVDAPNGRSYLYQFAAAPVAGVEFEHRGALLGPWISERGKLRLREFAESMLRQGRAGPGQGLTEQARLLLGRTALSGELRLGEGLVAVPGVQVHLEGRPAIGLRSPSVGRGVTVEMSSVSARDAAAAWQGARVAIDSMSAKLQLVFTADDEGLRFALDLASGKAAALRLDLQPGGSTGT